MAKIPTAETLGTPGISAGIAQVNVPRADMTSVTEANNKAVGNLSDAIGGAVSLGVKIHDEDEDFEMQKRFVDFDMQQERKLAEAKASAPADPVEFSRNWRRSYDADANAFFGKGGANVPERSRDKYDLALSKRGAAYEGQALEFEMRGRAKFHVDDLEGQILNIEQNVMAVPDPQRVRENVGRALSLIQTSRIPNDQKMDLMRKTSSRMEETAVRARIERGDSPEDILRDLRQLPDGQSMRNESVFVKPGKGELATVVAGSGAELSVSSKHADRFAGLLRDLEAAGVNIDGKQYGLAVLANNGSDESVALMTGGLLREFTRYR